MPESLVVRTTLLLYVLFSLGAAWLLWRNSAAPDALKNAGVIFASLIPVLLSLFPYFRPERMETSYNAFLIQDGQSGLLTDGDSPINPYSYGYMPVFVSLDPKDLKVDLMSNMEIGLDFIERGILESFFTKFMSHWDMQIKKSDSPVGTSERWNLSSAEKEEVGFTAIKEKFKHNALISKQEKMGFGKLFLPPMSKVAVAVTPHQRVIKIKNPFCELTIEVGVSHAIVAQQGIWGVVKPDPLDMNRFKVANYPINIWMTPSRTRTYSPEMQLYRRWYTNVSELLRNFDWANIETQVRRGAEKQVFEKVLSDGKKM